MANRSTLHKSKLEDFKVWLTDNGWSIESTKGYYEVLRARKGKQLLLVFFRHESKEHYTVQDGYGQVVRDYLRARK